jgi:leucyl aminopeptidase
MALTFPILTTGKATPLYLQSTKTYAAWLKKQPERVKSWLNLQSFEAKPCTHCLLPAENGTLAGVVCGTEETLNIWSIANLPAVLPAGNYALSGDVPAADATQLALGWALATYEFIRYRKLKKSYPTLIVPKGTDVEFVRSMWHSICWARDLINTPANDMHPAALAAEAVQWAKAAKGTVRVIKGEALLTQNYPMIYTVGKAAEIPPHLVDIRFARKGAPKVTLVGKGVTFDSGGLDIKPSSGMKMMKKDMGGAASVLALARVIVETGLPVELRVMLPIVENAVAGNAMRPLDIVKTRKGITVEIGNTDAEGRLILCDTLYEADSETPDLLIDCATLTGAARVALGTDIPAFFTNNNSVGLALAEHAAQQHDPLWQLPLWSGYRAQLNTGNADLSNDPESSYAGAITAALYLQEFVGRTPAWIHIDMMAWNLKAKAGRPEGGEAMAVRALYALIKDKYGKRKR